LSPRPTARPARSSPCRSIANWRQVRPSDARAESRESFPSPLPYHDDGRVLHQAGFGEAGDDRTRSTIAAVGNQLFIRANAKLYCVGPR
jgi:hypothetical protein